MTDPISHPMDAEYSNENILPQLRGRQHLLSIMGIILILIPLVLLLINGHMRWPLVGRYLFSRPILYGLLQTFLMTVVAMVISLIIGGILGLMRLSGSRVLVAMVEAYVWIFRAIPLLVQLLVWYNLGALWYRIGIGSFSVRTTDVITPWAAAILGLALHEAAYTAEVFRAGLMGVPTGQIEAAKMIGLSGAHTMRYVILPQALRIMIPPFGNNTIQMLKSSSLVSVIGLTDLLHAAQSIYARTYQTIPLLAVACIWYLVAVSILTVLQRVLERRVAGGGKHIDPEVH